MALIKIDWNPDARKLRGFGIGLFVFAALVFAVAYFKGKPVNGLTAWAFFSALGTLTLAWPAAGRGIYKAWMSVAMLIGTIVSTALMAFLYFGVITPLALLLRLTGRDALQLRPAPGESYWNVLKYPADPAYFERLF